MPPEESPEGTCRLILLPMLGAFLAERLYNHFINPEAAVFIAGWHVHHLFFGIILAIPASCALAFRIGGSQTQRAATTALGAGTGLILDEFVVILATLARKRASP